MTDSKRYSGDSKQSRDAPKNSGESEEETGWDRVRSLFHVRYGEPLPEEVKDFPTVVMAATGVGFMFGGLLGSRFAADKFIAINHHSKFSSTMQAQRQLHSAAMLGFARHGLKWGWRMGMFAGLFSGTTILLASYRDRDDALNYIAAGGVTGGAFRLSMGVMPSLAGAVLGMLITFPFALLVDGLGRLIVGTEEKQRIRERMSRARKERWEQKLEATTQIIDEMEEEGSGDGLRGYYSLKAPNDVSDGEGSDNTSRDNAVSDSVNNAPTSNSGSVSSSKGDKN